MLVAIENTDGGVWIMQLADPKADAAAVRREFAKWSPEMQAKVASWKVIGAEDIPASRRDRDAWRLYPDKKVRVDPDRKPPVRDQR